MNGSVEHGDELARLGHVLRWVIAETHVTLDGPRSEEIFRRVLVKLESRRRSRRHRFMQALREKWRHLRSALAAPFQRASHET
jgi:hypothetical protein